MDGQNMGNRFSGKAEVELFKMHAKGMALIEGVWAEMASRKCEAAGEDRLCDDAMASAESREMLGLAKAFHAKADLLAAKYGSFPVARGGDR